MLTACNLDGKCDGCGYEHKSVNDKLVFGFKYDDMDDYSITLCEDCLKQFVDMGIDCLGGPENYNK